MPTESTARFSDRASDYDAHRPSYPSEAIDAIFDGLGEANSLVAVDIGAGTGISSRLLAERGARVFAVEPNEAMRMRGAAHECAGVVEWIDGTGEATGLPNGVADVVLCAQAFHWLDTRMALEEFRRLLKPGGRAALLWNQQDARDPFTKAYRDLLQRLATEPPRSPSYAKAPPRPLIDHPEWVVAQILAFEYAQELDEPGLIGRAVSSSYCPREGEGRAAVEAGLRSLFEEFQHEGQVLLRYETELQLARRA